VAGAGGELIFARLDRLPAAENLRLEEETLRGFDHARFLELPRGLDEAGARRDHHRGGPLRGAGAAPALDEPEADGEARHHQQEEREELLHGLGPVLMIGDSQDRPEKGTGKEKCEGRAGSPH
jgi:hypothetical protein